MSARLQPGQVVRFAKLKTGASVVTVDLYGDDRTDLGVAIEFQDGTTRVLMGHLGDFGSMDAEPYIQIQTENTHGTKDMVKFDLARMDHVRRVVVFTYNSDGSRAHFAGVTSVAHHPQQGDYMMTLGHSAGVGSPTFSFESDGEGGLVMSANGTPFDDLQEFIDRFGR